MNSSTDHESPSIIVSEDGPYLVHHVTRLENSRDEAIPARSMMALCRCGGSAKKPFCDGTHARIGFSGSRLNDGSNDRRIAYRGREITIHDNRGVCAHAGHCTQNLTSVFRNDEEPWIEPDGATVERIIEVVKRCPSGALSYALDNVEYACYEGEPKIVVSKDGPYEVAGAPELRLESGESPTPNSKDRYTLCRCGGSKNKPFCDGTHWEIEFKDEKN